MSAARSVEPVKEKRRLLFLVDGAGEPAAFVWVDSSSSSSSDSTGSAGNSAALIASSAGPLDGIGGLGSSSAGPFNPSPSGSSSAGKSFELRRSEDNRGGNSGISSSFSTALCVLFRRRYQRKVRARIAARPPTPTPTPTPICTDIPEWLTTGEDDEAEDVGVVEFEFELVLDADVEEGAAVSAVVGSPAVAEETGGSIVKRLLGSWQHRPVL